MKCKEPANSVLLEKILNIAGDIFEIKNHLSDLNGKVAKHESFISRQGLINVILGAIGGSVLASIVGGIFK